MSVRLHALLLAPALSFALVCSGCGWGGGSHEKVVVVYSSLDREFSEPILKAYGKKAGVRVDAKFDVESTKTVGLTQLLIFEAPSPRCDLFWNNEILNTLRLKEKGLLAPMHPRNAEHYPEIFKAKDGTWYGFAARAANPAGQHPPCPGVRAALAASATCSTRSGRGRSGSPSRSSARRPRTPPACSRRGVKGRRRRSSAT